MNNTANWTIIGCLCIAGLIDIILGVSGANNINIAYIGVGTVSVLFSLFEVAMIKNIANFEPKARQMISVAGGILAIIMIIVIIVFECISRLG